MDPITAPANGDTTPCLSLTSRKSRESLAIAASEAALRPGSQDARSRPTTLGILQSDLTAAEIIAKMRNGDRLARLVWHRYINRVARGLSVVVNTLDPDILVMGGGMSNVDELYTDLPPELARYIFSTVFETPIRKAVHGDSSGVRGAAWLWKEN